MSDIFKAGVEHGPMLLLVFPGYSQCLPDGFSYPTTVTNPPPGPTGTVPPTNANFWFSFGDSYTQTGFTPTGNLPNDANPLGNPIYPGWTSSGGENWVDLVTTVYNNSQVYTYNLAYGGATIDANLVIPFEPTVLSLTDQVDQFLTNFANKSAAAWKSENTLFSIWIGINDIGNSWYLGGDRDVFSDTLLDAEFALVQKLYDAGARNFLFGNVPCLERTPTMLAQNEWSQTTEKAVIAGFNSKLASRVDALKAANEGVETWIWDTNTQFNTMLDSPDTYGFTNITSWGTDLGLFWINDYHPGSHAHHFLGQYVGQTVLADTIW